MKLVYDVKDKVPLKKNLVFAFQQLLAIMAATLLVPALVNNGANPDGTGINYMNQAAALCGAGFGTLFYIFVTKKLSPVFLGSSFAFISPLIGAAAFGYCGIFLGAVFAGLVYALIAAIIKATGSAWVNKLLPPVVIGPTVALIGLSLCGSAVGNLKNNGVNPDYELIYILLGIIAFFITVWASVKGGKRLSMVPFIIGILGAYVIGLILTFCGIPVVKLDAFKDMKLF
mgnify:CR=1 FL=1